MAGEDNKPSRSVPEEEEIIAIDTVNEEDNDAGYIDPVSLRQEPQCEHHLPTTTCIDPGHNSTNGHSPTSGHSLPTNGHSLPVNGHSLPVNGMNGHHRYIQHHGSRSKKYTKNILHWIQQKINCLLSWIISILAIVSMVLKLPFFVFLVTVLLDLIKQRLKAKAAAAKNSASVESINKPYEEEPSTGGSSGGQCKYQMYQSSLYQFPMYQSPLYQFPMYQSPLYQPPLYQPLILGIKRWSVVVTLSLVGDSINSLYQSWWPSTGGLEDAMRQGNVTWRHHVYHRSPLFSYSTFD